MNILNYFVFLLLKVVSLDAFAEWQMGVGFKVVMDEMRKYAKERNYTKSSAKWIVQRLDNFDDQEKRTWKMRYIENFEYFQQNGPIYLFIGGEGPMLDTISSLSLEKLAKETHGAILLSEHRYYGASIPLNNSVTENLKYLSSEQALADLANLIKFIKSQTNFERSKVVAVGGSYPGNLAAWMRATYPDIVDCAWASSAPVLAKKDFVEYLEQVGEDFIKYGSKQCYEKIVQKFSRYHKLLQSTEGIKQLKQEQNICEETDMTKPLNKASFFSEMVSEYQDSAQYGTPIGIKKKCNEITACSEDKHLNLTGTLKLENVSKTEDNCVNYTFNPRPCYTWIYQTCTEFGYFQTSDSTNQPFSTDLILDYYTDMCSLCYGPEFNEARVDKAVAYANQHYGGLSPNVTKVIFLHGSLDPWHRLGVTKSLSDDVPAVMIEGTSHCQDLFSYDSSEPKELTKAREYAEQMIKYWLGLGPRPTPFNVSSCVAYSI